MDQDWELIDDYKKKSRESKIDKPEVKEVVYEPAEVVDEPAEVVDEVEEAIDESEADIILKAPLEISKKNTINLQHNIIEKSPIKINTNKIIRSSLGYIIFSEKFWFNASIIALKYGDIDWRIKCLCLSDTRKTYKS